MKVIDAFAGLGGFSLAADALGWDTVAFVEWDKDCQFWLGEHWPGISIYGDITTVRWEDAPRCDIFTAGFPCQPHSVAGKREASADDRDLWSECVRAISALRPRYAVLENVSGLLTSESGRFFNRVLSDLAKIGYVGRYDVLSAAECGAPHRRERVWIVAYPAHDDGRRGVGGTEAGAGADGERGRRHSSSSSVGHSASGGWGAGEGEPVRRALRGRDGVGDTDRERGEEYRNVRQSGGSFQSDGRPDRLEYAEGERCGEREPIAEPGEAPTSGKRADVGHSDSRRGEQDSVSTELWTAGHQQGPVVSRPTDARERQEVPRRSLRNPWADAIPYRGADGTVRLIPSGAIEEEVSRPEPALRALADGLPDGLAGRAAAEEVEAWPTLRAGTPGSRLLGENGKRMGGKITEEEAQKFGGTGGSLWPVTDSEPGRVARLKAVGNSVCPSWVLAGPFQFILNREGLRDGNPDPENRSHE